MRKASGSIEWRSGCWHARLSTGDGKRERHRLSRGGRDLTNKEADRKVAQELAAELSQSVRTEQYTHPRLRGVGTGLTVEAFGETWTSGELLKKHGEVNGLGEKKSADDDAGRLRLHVYPHLGAMPVRDVDELDIEQCLASAYTAAEERLGKALSQNTKLQIYQVLKRLFDLAIMPGRLRSDNPVTIHYRPGKAAPKLYAYLFPTELTTLLGCVKVPLQRRVFYAFAAYTGLRLGSLDLVRRCDVDFEHKAITSLSSKTGIAQVFVQSDPMLPGLESLLVLLKRWFERSGIAATDPIVNDLQCPNGHEAQTLRKDLKAAGITRAILFTQAPNVQQLRFHDLRATFVTWARRAGKGTGWISDRTGHLTPEIMQRYDRGARSLTDLQIASFPDISAAIPELAQDAPNVIRMPERR